MAGQFEIMKKFGDGMSKPSSKRFSFFTILLWSTYLNSRILKSLLTQIIVFESNASLVSIIGVHLSYFIIKQIRRKKNICDK